MTMTKRLVACLTVTALLSAGCKKKQDGRAAGSGSSSTSSPSGAAAAASEPTPGPAASAAGTLASKLDDQTTNVVKKLAATPVSDRVTKLGKLLDATIAAAESDARDRSWDPASVIAKVGKDRAKLFAWVHDQTALVPYAGALRGSVGVMMDRVGNSLDRSLLLANLLEQAGSEVQLAHATLDQATAEKIAAGWRSAARPVFPTTTEDPAAAAQVAEAAAAIGVAASMLDQRVARAEIAAKARAQVDAQVGQLAKMFEATAVAPANDAAVLADHWWVQVKDGDAWTDLDLAETAPGTSLVQASETMARTALPEAMQHRVTIRVIGEVWHGAKREETTLAEHAFTPAEFYGQHLMVTAMPTDMPEPATLDAQKDRPAAVRAALVAQKEWVPMIIMGVTPVAHYSVTDGGELYDQMDPNQATTRVGRAVQRATKNGVGGATDMLEGMPSGSDVPAAPKPVAGPQTGFTAEWIEIEVRAPNAPARIVRRNVFDAYGSPPDRSSLKPLNMSDTAKLDRGLALIGQTSILTQFARIPEGFVASRVAKYLGLVKPAILAVVQNDGKDPSDEIKATTNQALPPPDELEDLALMRFSLDASTHAYMNQVNVLTSRRRLVPVDGKLRARKAFDIVTNGVGGWGDPVEARKARFAQGVADTVAESVLRPCLGANCLRGPNTSDAFVDARGWARVTAASSQTVAGLPADAKLVALADLASGYTLVAPSDGKLATWWRVRPDTGETLGEGALGGTEFTEYLIQFSKGVVIGLGFDGCMVSSADNGHMFGCMVAVAIGGWAGNGFVVGRGWTAILLVVAALLGLRSEIPE